MQILISGVHRSGTSLTARLVNMMGAYFAPEGASRGFGEDNPKGFWERKDVMRINDSLLKLQGYAWNQVTTPRPFSGAAQVPEDLRQAMRRLILHMDAHRPWFIKDPRLCLTLPYWKPMLEVPVCVIVYRHPLEVAASLVKRAIRSPEYGIPTVEYGIALWEIYAVSLLDATARLPRIFVSHSHFLSDPVAAAHDFYAALVQQGIQGLRLPSEREIAAFIDPALYRSKPNDKFGQAYTLTPHQQELTAMMQGAPLSVKRG